MRGERPCLQGYDRIPKPGARGLLSELGICLAAARLATYVPLANAGSLVISCLAAIWQFASAQNHDGGTNAVL